MTLSLTAGLVGFASGVLVTAGAARWIIVRHLRKVRAAERRARAAERMAEIGSMTGGLAHEIKNPLSTIGLNAQLLGEAIDDLPLSDEEKGRLGRRIGSLRREVERLKGILSDFLRYAGELHLEPAEADLNEIAQDLVDFLHAQAQQSGITLRAELAPGPLVVRVDVAHMKQAVLNLMLNAIQAMSAMAQPVPGKPRELILRTGRTGDSVGGDAVVLHVIDTGPGIPPETADKIFQPYFTTKSAGTGLGLPTTKRIVEAHGARLDLHSTPGVGTDFSIVIPVSPRPGHAGS